MPDSAILHVPTGLCLEQRHAAEYLAEDPVWCDLANVDKLRRTNGISLQPLDHLPEISLLAQPLRAGFERYIPNLLNADLLGDKKSIPCRLSSHAAHKCVDDEGGRPVFPSITWTHPMLQCEKRHDTIIHTFLAVTEKHVQVGPCLYCYTHDIPCQIEGREVSYDDHKVSGQNARSLGSEPHSNLVGWKDFGSWVKDISVLPDLLARKDLEIQTLAQDLNAREKQRGETQKSHFVFTMGKNRVDRELRETKDLVSKLEEEARKHQEGKKRLISKSELLQSLADVLASDEDVKRALLSQLGDAPQAEGPTSQKDVSQLDRSTQQASAGNGDPEAARPAAAESHTSEDETVVQADIFRKEASDDGSDVDNEAGGFYGWAAIPSATVDSHVKTTASV